METPAQLIDRLGRMGESRVRGLMAKNYFPAHARELVASWLDEQQEARERALAGPPVAAAPSSDGDTAKAQALARRAVAEAKLAKDAAVEARTQAQKAQKWVATALALGTIGVVSSIGILFVLIFR